MSKPDWESLQIKVIRSLFLAVSSVFVVFYGCSGTALASELQEDTPSIAKADASEKIISIEKTAPSVQLAASVSLAAVSQPSAHLSTQLVEQTPPTLSRLIATLPASEDGVAVGSDAAAAPMATEGNNSAADQFSGDCSLLAVETAQVQEATPIEVDSTRAEDLEIPSRFGASFSTSTAGFDEVLGVNAFVPINQGAGEEVTFLEGGVQLVGGNLSASVNIGHRNYDLDDDVINGGYLGVDARSTDSSTIYQLAGGYEYIEEDWEWRVNGYLPIGNDTNTLRSVNDDSNVVGTSQFQGNQLVLSAAGERQRILQQENALGGFDLEVGAQLDAWDGGELM